VSDGEAATAASPGSDWPADALAASAIGLLIVRGLTVGTAESLTGGLVAAALTTVPGSSAAFRGGIVAYAADLKESQLGVPPALLQKFGTVHRDVALAMAAGVRRRLGVAVGVATTGVAGPGPADGQPAGTVHVAVDAGAGPAHRRLALTGDRSQVRSETVRAVLALLMSVLKEDHR
jgi:nicotinamide-nucleotide amidase